MHKLNSIQFVSASLRVICIAVLLVGCSDDSGDEFVSDRRPQELVSITFSAGPNAGKHRYVASQLPNAGVSLSYSRPNAVSFFAASGLVSEDQQLSIGSLRRFTEGELQIGANAATSWLPNKNVVRSTATLDCGRLEIRDLDDTRGYKVVYGTFQDCGPTTIEEIGEWQIDQQSKIRTRRVIGSFSDRLKLQVAMDNARFQNIESEILVEFSMLQREVIAAN